MDNLIRNIIHLPLQYYILYTSQPDNEIFSKELREVGVKEEEGGPAWGRCPRYEYGDIRSLSVSHPHLQLL